MGMGERDYRLSRVPVHETLIAGGNGFVRKASVAIAWKRTIIAPEIKEDNRALVLVDNFNPDMNLKLQGRMLSEGIGRLGDSQVVLAHETLLLLEVGAKLTGSVGIKYNRQGRPTEHLSVAVVWDGNEFKREEVSP
jgi:hypothetical protein